MMAELILGPLLRHVGKTDATVWVETDEACEVEVLGHKTPTFTVADHHYALVLIEGLAPATTHEYGVKLDGRDCWPLAGQARSVICTLDRARPFRLVFGSCRVVGGHEADDQVRFGVDALWALAMRMRRQPPDAWPQALLLLGDQVYADKLPPRTQAFVRARRGDAPPRGEVADFAEYAQLYRESWSDPIIRWLLSTLPSAMIFDDHEVHDDWNTSHAWKEDIRRKPWWQERIVAALMAYWLYQHLGNLSPRALADDELFAAVRAAPDGTALLHDFAARAERTTAGSRFSYHRDFGAARLVVVDSRAGRVLTDGERDMLDEEEWRWLEDQLVGDVDHLLVASSLPVLLPPAIHDVEAWNEAVCAGAWGRRAAGAGERLRRLIDLEHWAAFASSFARLGQSVRAVAGGKRGAAPATVGFLSGDVHYAYLADVDLGTPVESVVYQAVCSPLRNSLPRAVALASRAATAPATVWAANKLARSARVPRPPLAWQVTSELSFANQLGTLELDGRAARVSLERASADEPFLVPTLARELTAAPSPAEAGLREAASPS